MEIQQIFVIGAGAMGSGIAQTAAVSGFQVDLMDVDAAQLEKARATIERSTARLLEKEKITAAQRRAALEIRCTQDLAPAEQAGLVIEAAAEKEAIKLAIFAELELLAKPEAILASNTSSIGITKIAAATHRPQQVIGCHFMNPVPLMRLVEVVRGLETNQQTVDAILQVCRRMEKEPVEAKDSPGFISNRILCPMINEAVFALQEGVGSIEAVDTVMKLGMNHPMGPLALCDLIGLDVVLSVMEVLQHDLGDDKYRPAYLLRQMVDAGRLGRKSGRGFYSY